MGCCLAEHRTLLTFPNANGFTLVLVLPVTSFAAFPQLEPLQTCNIIGQLLGSVLSCVVTFAVQPRRRHPYTALFCSLLRSFAQERSATSFLFNHQRTLCVNTGGGIKSVHSHFGTKSLLGVGPFLPAGLLAGGPTFTTSKGPWHLSSLHPSRFLGRVRRFLARLRVRLLVRRCGESPFTKSSRIRTYGIGVFNSFRIRTYEKTGGGAPFRSALVTRHSPLVLPCVLPSRHNTRSRRRHDPF